MKNSGLLCFLSTLCTSAFAHPQTASSSGISPNFGKTSVPFGPNPSGCSKFEILVGECEPRPLVSSTNNSAARGTSEPGPFGVIAGDPLVKNVAAAIPDSRGYAVQVSTLHRSLRVNLQTDPTWCSTLQHFPQNLFPPASRTSSIV
jgi:hypothetical protein